eukprot:gene11575-4821_t
MIHQPYKIENIQTTEPWISHVQRKIENNNLISVNLSIFSIQPQDDHLLDLNEILEIKHLDLSTCFEEFGLGKNITEKSILKKFIQTLHVSSLHFSGNKLKCSGVSLLDPIVPNFHLCQLNLSKNLILNVGCKFIAFIISSYPNLEYLNLSENKISDVGLIPLFNKIKKHPKLKHLDIRKNCISNHGITSLFDLIASKSVIVKFTSKEFSNIRDYIDSFQNGDIHYEIPSTDERELKLYCELIHMNPKFKSFSFADEFRFKRTTFMLYLENFQHNSNIQDIDFSNLDCSPELWNQLINSLQYYPNLETLSFWHFEEVFIPELVVILSNLPKIEVITFYSSLSNEYFEHVLDFISKKKSMKSLRFLGDLSTDQLFIIEKYSKSQDFLDELWIEKFLCTDKDVKCLKQILWNSSISSFFISWTDEKIKSQLLRIVEMSYI